MEIKSKSKEEIEDIAFRTLRNTKDKTMLSNRNVDCFVAGWQAADRDFLQQLNSQKAQEFKDYLQQTIDQCKEKHNNLHRDLGYGGYMYTIPKSADAFFKMLDEMIRSCAFILANLENVNLYHGDYYEKLKGGEQ